MSEVLLGALIGAGSALMGQLITAFFNHKTSLQIKKLGYFMEAHRELSSVLDEINISIISLDHKSVIADTRNYYQGRESYAEFNDSHLLDDYRVVVKLFFKYRHLVSKEIRKACDEAYIQVREVITKVRFWDNFTHSQFSLEDQEKFAVNFHLLSGLMFAGILNSLEKIAENHSK